MRACACVCACVMDVCWCWGPVTVIWRLSESRCRRVCLCMWVCVWGGGGWDAAWHYIESSLSRPSAFRQCHQTAVWRTRQTSRHTHSHKLACSQRSICAFACARLDLVKRVAYFLLLFLSWTWLCIWSSELGGLEMVSLNQTKLAHVKHKEVLRPAMKTQARTTFSFCPVAQTFWSLWKMWSMFLWICKRNIHF